MKRNHKFLWNCPFFGLGPNYRPILYDIIFDIIWKSDGKLTSFIDIYNLPVHIRNYYHNKINKIYTAEVERTNLATKKNRKHIDKPNFNK